MWFASSMSHHEALAPWLTIEQGNGLSPTIQVSRGKGVLPLHLATEREGMTPIERPGILPHRAMPDANVRY
jgi:hypothetical protein